MTTKTVYVFAESFGRFPGGRYRRHGPASGEQFFDDVLETAFENSEQTVLDLRDVMGFATSFLDGAFGEFAAKYGIAAFDQTFEVLIDEDDETLLPAIRMSLTNGESERA